MSYTPPLGDSLEISFVLGYVYNPPPGTGVPMDFTSIGDGSAFLFEKRGSSILLLQPG